MTRIKLPKKVFRQLEHELCAVAESEAAMGRALAVAIKEIGKRYVAAWERVRERVREATGITDRSLRLSLDSSTREIVVTEKPTENNETTESNGGS